MPNPIDLTKPIQTRDGRAATDLRVDGTDGSISGAVISHGIKYYYRWWTDGRLLIGDEPHPLDLINVPEASDG